MRDNCIELFSHQGKLLEIMLLDKTTHKSHKTRRVQRKGDEAVVRHKWPQEILGKGKKVN